ncbi:MAG: sigma-70 family RNA polymerase sigma factor [Leptospiraceae bacterium]|nr:sigma-70 family RNA polymerase sigma factor [Leptospiraceae bacterium]MCP5494693.1 sigma-70 family RNA polymerase sigma factor [Leptospiraceae bacterium]
MKHKQQDFSEFMRKAQGGDDKSYHILLSGILEMLRSLLYSKIQNVQDREDVIQNILMAVHKARHTYIPKKPFSPWLGAIIRNKVIDYYRLQKRHSITDFVEIPDIEDNRHFVPQDISEEYYANLLKAVGELPEKQRVIFKMLKIDGLSIKEVSLKTGYSESNVKVTAHRVYKRLKKLFWGDEHEN